VADDRFQWLFELVDKVSGPARAMGKALAVVEKAKDRLSKGAGKKVGALFDQLSDKNKVRIVGVLQRLGEVQSKVTAGLGKMGQGLSYVGKTAMGAGVEMAKIAGIALGGLAIVGAKFAYDSLTFKENTLAGFKVMLGSAEAAESVYNRAVKVAADTSFGAKEVVSSIQKLVIAGFDQNAAFDAFKVIGDIAVVKGSEGVESVIRAVGQIKAKGRLQGEEMLQLAEAGVSQKLVYEALGKTFGKTEAQVRKLQEAGKLTADQAIPAIFEAITKGVSGGKAGSLQEVLSKTLSGRMSTLGSRPFELINAANLSQASGGFGKFIEDMAVALDPSSGTGQRIVGIIEKIGKTFADMFGSPDVAGGLNKMLDIIDPLVTMGLKFITGFGSGFKAFAPAFDAAMRAMGMASPETVDRLARGIETMGTAWGFLTAAIVLGGASVLAVPLGIIEKFQWMVDKVKGAIIEIELTVDRFAQIGRNIIDGLWRGIQEAWTAFMPNWRSLIDTLPYSARAALGIASPSRVFAEIGGFSAEGFAQGFVAANSNAQIAQAVQPPASIARGAGGGGSMAGASINVNVTVQLGAGATPQQAEELGRHVGRGIMAEMSSSFETMAMEIGVAAA